MQGLKIMVAWLPVVTRNFQLVANFLLDVWELAFGDADAVSLNEIYLLLCAIAQNSGI
jgi:hypothetical protein